MSMDQVGVPPGAQSGAQPGARGAGRHRSRHRADDTPDDGTPATPASSADPDRPAPGPGPDRIDWPTSGSISAIGVTRSGGWPAAPGNPMPGTGVHPMDADHLGDGPSDPRQSDPRQGNPGQGNPGQGNPGHGDAGQGGGRGQDGWGEGGPGRGGPGAPGPGGGRSGGWPTPGPAGPTPGPYPTGPPTGGPGPNGGRPTDNTGGPGPSGGRPLDNAGGPGSSGGRPSDNVRGPGPNGGRPTDNAGGPGPNGGRPSDNAGSGSWPSAAQPGPAGHSPSGYFPPGFPPNAPVRPTAAPPNLPRPRGGPSDDAPTDPLGFPPVPADERTGPGDGDAVQSSGPHRAARAGGVDGTVEARTTAVTGMHRIEPGGSGTGGHRAQPPADPDSAVPSTGTHRIEPAPDTTGSGARPTVEGTGRNRARSPGPDPADAPTRRNRVEAPGPPGAEPAGPPATETTGSRHAASGRRRRAAAGTAPAGSDVSDPAARPPARRPAAPLGTGHGHGHSPAPPSGRRVRILIAALLVPCALAALVGLVVLWPGPAPQPPNTLSQQPVRATVVQALASDCSPGSGTGGCVTLLLAMSDGPLPGRDLAQVVPVEPGTPSFAVGDEVVLGWSGADPTDPGSYQVVDFQRGQPLIWLAALFAAAVLVLGRWRGLAALGALALSFAVLLFFVLPAILTGHDPLAVAVVGSGLIMFAVLYLTHGFSARTSVAVLGTLVSLALIGALGTVFSATASLTGLDDQTANLIASLGAGVDARGLLLAGVVIGALGVLDDVTVTQTSAVWELRRANPALSAGSLFTAAMRIGRDHVASAVNTLVLAYAGAALPLMLLFSLSGRALGDVLTSQDVATEIIRTLVGSIGLVASVPITTALAAVVASRERIEPEEPAQERALATKVA
jgi:uncharacterized membrane protein